MGSNKKRFTDDDRSGFPAENASKPEWRIWAGDQAVPNIAAVSSVIAYHLAAWIPGGSTVLTFLPMEGEVDLMELEQLHLTLVTTRTPDDGWLTLHRWDEPRDIHRWGFENPAQNAAVFKGHVDVALVPGVAFDVVGRRLGHGKGYYDQLLSTIDVPVVIGVCPSQLVVPALPHESHDVLMTHLVTEFGVKELRNGHGVRDG